MNNDRKQPDQTSNRQAHVDSQQHDDARRSTPDDASPPTTRTCSLGAAIAADLHCDERITPTDHEAASDASRAENGDGPGGYAPTVGPNAWSADEHGSSPRTAEALKRGVGQAHDTRSAQPQGEQTETSSDPAQPGVRDAAEHTVSPSRPILASHGKTSGPAVIALRQRDGD